MVIELILTRGEREALTEDVSEDVARGLVVRRAERVALGEAAVDLDADVDNEGIRLTDADREDALDAVFAVEGDSICDAMAELDGEDERLGEEDSESSRVLLALTEGECEYRFDDDSTADTEFGADPLVETEKTAEEETLDDNNDV